MDISKLKIPLYLVIGAISASAGFGVSVATASAKQAALETQATSTERRVDELQKRTEEDRLDVRELKTISQSTLEAVREIKRKLDHREP